MTASLQSAAAYHAGLTSNQRQKVQRGFMTNKIRVVVATVAFGMGLDKADVGAVVHFHVPKSLEDYVRGPGATWTTLFGRPCPPARA